MKRAQIIRIALLLIAIFAAGLLTGRLTAPEPPVLVRNVAGRYSTWETLMARLKEQLALSAEQERQFAPIVEDAARQMSELPPASAQRLEVFRRMAPKMQALLRPDQEEKFQRYVRETEARWQRLLQRQSDKEKSE